MRERMKMRLSLGEQRFSLEKALHTTTLNAEDSEKLGRLMFESYRNTVDDEGESLEEAVEEAQRTISGAYGPMLFECSFSIAEEERLIAACVITVFQGAPLLAFSMTIPTKRRRGTAEYLIRRALDELEDAGYREIYLYVTVANTPALRMYEKLGFTKVPEDA